MRLIDADELKINLYHNKKVVLNDDLVKCIDDTETAYSVDKVVDELDEYITKIVGRKSALYQTIMQIVKGGGKDEIS